MLSKYRLVMLPFKTHKQTSSEEGNLSFLNSFSTRAESFPLLCKQALSPSTSSCPRLWTTQRENHLWTTEKRQVLKHLQGLLLKNIYIFKLKWLRLLSDFMVTVGQGSQAGISVLWEHSSCKTLVVDKTLSTTLNSLQSKTHHSSELKWEKSCRPDTPPHIPPALTAKCSGRRTRLFFSRCSARKNSGAKQLFLFTDSC